MGTKYRLVIVDEANGSFFKSWENTYPTNPEWVEAIEDAWFLIDNHISNAFIRRTLKELKENGFEEVRVRRVQVKYESLD